MTLPSGLEVPTPGRGTLPQGLEVPTHEPQGPAVEVKTLVAGLQSSVGWAKSRMVGVGKPLPDGYVSVTSQASASSRLWNRRTRRPMALASHSTGSTAARGAPT
jgi:hypothetical protein